MKENEIIKFIRERDYIFLEDIGQGACGKTILLKDNIIDENFVCKKYETYNPANQYEYFENFKNEIKLLHLLYHKNIVRVFNYYLYPDKYTGYIIMEYIKGNNISEYINANPEKINDVFRQVLEGFKYLEDNKILHRDIRNNNILINNEGTVKIIDFGFGKKMEYSTDNEKSISLNWIANPPMEFKEGKYDNKTEIYFIGKLFENIILENDIQNFMYNDLLKEMINTDYNARIDSFNFILKQISKIQFENPSKIENIEEMFTEDEINSYRTLSKALCNSISMIEESTKFIDDTDTILKNINSAITDCILEEYFPSKKVLINCFLDGEYEIDREYENKLKINELKKFRNIFMNSGNEKRKIILRNIQTKLDAIQKYYSPQNNYLPF